MPQLVFRQAECAAKLDCSPEPMPGFGAAKYYLAKKGVAGEYDLSRLSQEEQSTLHALLQKAKK